MKTVMFLVVGGWLFFGVGCASVPPAENPVAAAPTPPANNSRIARAVKNWWDTPPPEVHEQKGDDGWGWCWFGYALEVLGTMLAK